MKILPLDVYEDRSWSMLFPKTVTPKTPVSCLETCAHIIERGYLLLHFSFTFVAYTNKQLEALHKWFCANLKIPVTPLSLCKTKIPVLLGLQYKLSQKCVYLNQYDMYMGAIWQVHLTIIIESWQDLNLSYHSLYQLR